MHGVVDLLALLHEDLGHAVGTAATGEGGVPRGPARVDGDDGVQAEDLVEDVLEVLAVLEADVGQLGRGLVGAEVGDDGLAELVEGVGMADEGVEDVAEEGSGGVSTCEEDVEELCAELDGVARLGGQSIQEDVFLLRVERFPLLEFRLFGILVQCGLNKAVDEVVAHLVCFPKLGSCAQPILVHKSDSSGQPLLGDVESPGEFHSVGASPFRGRCKGIFWETVDLRVDRLSKEEFTCRVESVAEEQNLEVYLIRPTILAHR